MSIRLRQLTVTSLLVLFAWGVAAGQTIEIPSTPDTGEGANNYAVATIGVSMPLADRVDLSVLGGYAGGDAVIKVLQVDLPIRINNYLTLTPGYFNLFVPPVGGRRDRDQRARGAATVRLSFRGFNFSDRNLGERRFRTSRDSTRYRNLLRIERPLAVKGFAFTPFVTDEAFYDFTARAWTRNHVAVGIRKTFGKRYTGDVYYQHESAQNAANNNLVFVGLTIRLDRMNLFRR